MEEHGHVLVGVEFVEEEREVVKPDSFLVDLVQGFLREEKGSQLMGDERGEFWPAIRHGGSTLSATAGKLRRAGRPSTAGWSDGKVLFVVAHFDAGEGPSGDSGELRKMID